MSTEMGSTINADLGKLLIPVFDFFEIRESLANDSMIVIDVREKSEMISPGRIPGTKHIPLNEVKMAFGELTSEEFEDRYDFPRPKRNLMGSPIILTCRSGVRASKAAETLQTLGFNAAIYKGSMLDWTEKGGKVLSGESEVTFEAVQRALSDKAKVMIDVRSKEEFKAGRIPGTFNVPLIEVWTAFQLDAESFQSQYGFCKPDVNDPIIIYCLAGRRARIASDKLSLLNFDNVDIYKGSFEDWQERGGEIESE